MGEPIRLWKGKKEIEVYGQHEANELVEHGWAVGPRPADVDDYLLKEVLDGAVPLGDVVPDVVPAGDAAPEPPAKPAKKKAGEYGSGTGSAPDTRVTKAKEAEVKAAKTQDAKDA